MRHPAEGTPYVPPPCPTEKYEDIPDLSALPFRLMFVPEPDGRTHIYGTFETPEDANGVVLDQVTTDVLHLPPGSPLEQKVRQLMNIDPNSDLPDSLKHTERLSVDIMRWNFCERVANCQGVDGDGECWALGAKAVRKVVGAILNVNDKT